MRDLIEHDRRQSLRGFVEQQHHRLTRDGDSKGQHLLLAAAEHARQLCAPLLQDREQLVDLSAQAARSLSGATGPTASTIETSA